MSRSALNRVVENYMGALPDFKSGLKLQDEARAELAALRQRVAALERACAEMIDRLIESEELWRRDNGDIYWSASGNLLLAAHAQPQPQAETEAG